MATKTLAAGCAIVLAGALAACSTATPPAPPAAAPVTTTIQLGRTANGGLIVPASVNGVPMRFVLDSGADSVVLPAAIAGPLFELGLLTKEEFVGKGSSVLANGSEAETMRFRLRSVTIGEITIHDIGCVVVDGDGPPLLGQSVLAVLPAWRVDNVTHTLIIS
jgi:clan AA aspartic protease (TIGR02281 family)